MWSIAENNSTTFYWYGLISSWDINLWNTNNVIYKNPITKCLSTKFQTAIAWKLLKLDCSNVGYMVVLPRAWLKNWRDHYNTHWLSSHEMTHLAADKRHYIIWTILYFFQWGSIFSHRYHVWGLFNGREQFNFNFSEQYKFNCIYILNAFMIFQLG